VKSGCCFLAGLLFVAVIGSAGVASNLRRYTYPPDFIAGRVRVFPQQGALNDRARLNARSARQAAALIAALWLSGRIESTGHGAWRTTRSVTLPTRM